MMSRPFWPGWCRNSRCLLASEAQGTCVLKSPATKPAVGYLNLRHESGTMRRMMTLLQRRLVLVALSVALGATALRIICHPPMTAPFSPSCLRGATSRIFVVMAPDAGDCPVCNSAAGVALSPVTPGVHAADLILLAAVVASRESRAVRGVLDPARGIRSPPLTLITLFKPNSPGGFFTHGSKRQTMTGLSDAVLAALALATALPAWADVTVTDLKGRTITLPDHPERAPWAEWRPVQWASPSSAWITTPRPLRRILHRPASSAR